MIIVELPHKHNYHLFTDIRNWCSGNVGLGGFDIGDTKDFKWKFRSGIAASFIDFPNRKDFEMFMKEWGDKIVYIAY